MVPVVLRLVGWDTLECVHNGFLHGTYVFEHEARIERRDTLQRRCSVHLGDWYNDHLVIVSSGGAAHLGRFVDN